MEEKQIQPTLYDIVLKKEWSYYTGSVLIVIFAMALCMFGSTWGVSGALGTWGNMFLSLFGIDTKAVFGTDTSTYKFFANQASITDIGILLGALIACLSCCTVEDQKHQALQAGSRCNHRRSCNGYRCKDGRRM